MTTLSKTARKIPPSDIKKLKWPKSSHGKCNTGSRFKHKNMGQTHVAKSTVECAILSLYLENDHTSMDTKTG